MVYNRARGHSPRCIKRIVNRINKYHDQTLSFYPPPLRSNAIIVLQVTFKHQRHGYSTFSSLRKICYRFMYSTGVNSSHTLLCSHTHTRTYAHREGLSDGHHPLSGAGQLVPVPVRTGYKPVILDVQTLDPWAIDPRTAGRPANWEGYFALSEWLEDFARAHKDIPATMLCTHCRGKRPR